MSRRLKKIWALLTSATIALPGCHPTQPFYFNEDGDLSHYVGVATEVDYPDVQTERLDEVEGAQAPLTLDNPTPKEFWDLRLEDVIKTTLANGKIARTLNSNSRSFGTSQSQSIGSAVPDALTSRADFAVSTYDPAIVETTPFTGVESALAAFDAQWTSNLFWEKNDRPQNVTPGGFVTNFFTRTFIQDNSTFNTQLSKVTATGGQFAVRNNINYDANNNPTRQVYSDYNVNIEATFAQPLLAGSGVQFNRIAGPQSPFTGTGTPNFDGVMLARISTDISLADFEGNVRNTVSDAENAYWDLYFDYRNLEATKAARESALQTWKKVHALYLGGVKGGEAEKEAQAREQYFFFRSQVETSLVALYRDENRLRYMMGLSVADGRLVRPADEPTTAKVAFDWHEIHCEGLARSVELRRQKWRIKQRELELIASRNLLQPRLDAVGRYRWLGLGDDFAQYGEEPTQGLIGTGAVNNLFDGNFQEWQLGFQASMPLGFRRELSQIRHYQLRLARERAVFQDQELEISHQLGDAVRSLEGNYRLTVSNFNRRVAASRQVEAVKAAFEADTVTLDLLLDAQRRRADAEVAYYRSLVDYNRSIQNVHFRKGSLLEYNGVYLAEGPWPAKAQFDAHRLARQRDASYYLDYGFTRPNVVSQGPYKQHGGLESDPELLGTPSEGVPHEAAPEEIPSPAPDDGVQPEDMQARSAITKQSKAPKQPQGRAARPARLRTTSTKKSNDAWASVEINSTSPVETAEQAAPQPTLAKVNKLRGSSTDADRETVLAVASEDVGRDRAQSDPSVDSNRAASNTMVQRATYASEWKSAAKHEPLSNSSAGATDRGASGWKSTQR